MVYPDDAEAGAVESPASEFRDIVVKYFVKYFVVKTSAVKGTPL